MQIFASSSVAPNPVGTSSIVCAGQTGRNTAIIVLSCLAVALLVCLCGACCRRPLLKSFSKGTPTSYGSPKSSAAPSCTTSTNSSDTRHQTGTYRTSGALKGSARLPGQTVRHSRSWPRQLNSAHTAAASKSEVVVQVIASDRLGWNGLPRQKREQPPTPASPEGRPRSPWKVVLGLAGSPGSSVNKPVIPRPVLLEEEPDATMKRSPRGSVRRAPLPPTPPELNTIDEGEEPSSRSIPMPGNTGTTDASGGAGTRSLSLQAPGASPSRSLHNVVEEYSGSESFGSSEDLDVTPTNSTSADGYSLEQLAYSPGGSLLSPRRGSTFSGTGDRRALLTDVVPRCPMSTGPPSPERDVPRALLSEPALKNAATVQPPSMLPRQPAGQGPATLRAGHDAGDAGPSSGHTQAPSCLSSAGPPCTAVDATDSSDPIMRSKSIPAPSDELLPQPRLMDSCRTLDSSRSDAWRTLAGERMYGDGLDATSTFGSCSNTFFLVPPKSLSREGSGELAVDSELHDSITEAGRRALQGTRLRRMSDELSRQARAAVKGTRSADCCE